MLLKKKEEFYVDNKYHYCKDWHIIKTEFFVNKFVDFHKQYSKNVGILKSVINHKSKETSTLIQNWYDQYMVCKGRYLKIQTRFVLSNENGMIEEQVKTSIENDYQDQLAKIDESTYNNFVQLMKKDKSGNSKLNCTIHNIKKDKDS